MMVRGHSNWKTKFIEKVANPKTSKSASMGRIRILLLFLIILVLYCF